MVPCLSIIERSGTLCQAIHFVNIRIGVIHFVNMCLIMQSER
jgi:hypothetical protein